MFLKNYFHRKNYLLIIIGIVCIIAIIFSVFYAVYKKEQDKNTIRIPNTGIGKEDTFLVTGKMISTNTSLSQAVVTVLWGENWAKNKEGTDVAFYFDSKAKIYEEDKEITLDKITKDQMVSFVGKINAETPVVTVLHIIKQK